jgi:hypothetical protein
VKHQEVREGNGNELLMGENNYYGGMEGGGRYDLLLVEGALPVN